MKRTIFLLFTMCLCLALVNCGGGSKEVNSSGIDDESSNNNTETTVKTLTKCEQEMEAASIISDMQDTVEDADAAIEVCGTLDELKAASEKFPDALDVSSSDVEFFVTNRCTYNPALVDTPICKSILE